MRLALLVSALVTIGSPILLVSNVALADKVTVLRFSGPQGAPSEPLERARRDVRAALKRLGHKEPTDAEIQAAEKNLGSGAPETTRELRAAGRATTSDWVFVGRVEPRVSAYRVELEVCQVDSGRVESLAREIDPAQADAQLGEMLSLMLRAEGIGTSEPPWLRAPTKVPPAAPSADPNKPPSSVVVERPLSPAAPAAKGAPYGTPFPFAAALGLGAYSAFARPSGAQGSPASMQISGAFGYVLSGTSLEFRGTAMTAVVGPQSLTGDVGARYAFRLAPRAWLFAGPDLAIGTLVTLGANKEARFLARGGGFISYGFSERIAVELGANALVAPGRGGALLLGGGDARASFRF